MMTGRLKGVWPDCFEKESERCQKGGDFLASFFRPSLRPVFRECLMVKRGCQISQKALKGNRGEDRFGMEGKEIENSFL